MPATEVALPGGRRAVSSMTVTAVALPLVTFESELLVDAEMLKSFLTLTFS